MAEDAAAARDQDAEAHGTSREEGRERQEPVRQGVVVTRGRNMAPAEVEVLRYCRRNELFDLVWPYLAGTSR